MHGHWYDSAPDEARVRVFRVIDAEAEKKAREKAIIKSCAKFIFAVVNRGIRAGHHLDLVEYMTLFKNQKNINIGEIK